MSFFDPQSLYVHRQKSTKRGQIIQKKPKPRVSATSPQDIPYAIAVLKNHGYYIFEPSNPPRIATYESQFTNFIQSYTVPLQLRTIRFNDIWLNNKSAFQSLIDIPVASLTGQSAVVINITSIYVRFQGGQSANDQVTIYNEGQTSLDYVSPHVGNNSYYTIIPNSISSVSIAKTTPSGGSTSTSPYAISPPTGILSQTSTEDTWDQLKRPEGLTDNKEIITFDSNNLSNYAAEIRINGYIFCLIGIYSS